MEVNMALIGWAIIYLIAAFFFNLWPFNGGSDTLPFSKYETTRVNAYFYYPNNQEVYLGEVNGASACQSAARNFAYSKNVGSSNWSYICCTIEKGSSCYRKIR